VLGVLLHSATSAARSTVRKWSTGNPAVGYICMHHFNLLLLPNFDYASDVHILAPLAIRSRVGCTCMYLYDVRSWMKSFQIILSVEEIRIRMII